VADHLSAIAWVAALAQALLFVLGAPLFTSWVKRVRCWLQNRRPPPLLQPYRDLRRLFAKRVVLAHSASLVFRVAPYIVTGTTVLAAAIVPLAWLETPFTAVADAIVLVGTLALGRFFLALAGLDVGTAFGGMGAAREMTFGALAEPALLLVIFTLAMLATSTNLATVIEYLLRQPIALRPSLLFAFIALVLVAIAETGRVPVDNPATHLELTMVHEAMILEYTGRHLALMDYAAQLKLAIYAVLIVDLFLPWGISPTLQLPAIAGALLAVAAKLALLGAALALAETATAKMRLFRVPTFLAVAFTLALIGLLSFIMLESRAR
jgi:formate hydrogenlyase subunit 4